MLWDMELPSAHRHRAPDQPLTIDTLELAEVIRHTLPAAATAGELACLRIHAAGGELSVTGTDGGSFARMLVALPEGSGDLDPCLLSVADAHQLLLGIGPRGSALRGWPARVRILEHYTSVGEHLGYQLTIGWRDRVRFSAPVSPPDGYPDVFELSASLFVTGNVL